MPVPKELDLSSVMAKVEWSATHFNIVIDEMSAWLKESKNALVYERNEDFTQHFVVAHMPGQRPDFRRWSLMIGDAITNLRDSLDHLIYAIAHLPNSPCPEKRDKACFVIAPTAKEFKDWGKTKLASVPQAVRDAMLRVQPFNRPHPILPPLLEVLAELANGNKHKVLNLAYTTPGIGQVQFISQSGFQQEGRYYLSNEEMTHGTIVVGFEVDIPDPQIKPDIVNIAMQIAVKHKPRKGDTSYGSDRTGVDQLFRVVFDEVNYIINAILEAL